MIVRHTHVFVKKNSERRIRPYVEILATMNVQLGNLRHDILSTILFSLCFNHASCVTQAPDRFYSLKSGDRKLYVVPKRRSTYLKALKL